MDNKYTVLCQILDGIRAEAPPSYKKYLDNSTDNSVNQARSKAFIHLFLLAQFGMSTFEEREQLITDGTGDGGLDAFYIDKEKKKIFLIQSKFRTNAKNFEEMAIKTDELLKMEIKSITSGKSKDTQGNDYNSKILNFQKKLKNIGGIASYDYVIVILANVTKYTDPQIKRLIGEYDYEIFNFNKTYEKLTFRTISGILHDPKEIEIKISLDEKKQMNLSQRIETSYGPSNVELIFAPTEEICRVVSKYKNSILMYNPRNYLSLAGNKVNKKIKDSILKGYKNDFSIFNNGITIITDKIKTSNETGIENEGQLILYNPQIINGGQTAYTLSEIYDDHKIDNSVFDGKEVLLRLVQIKNENDKYLNFIEKVSETTNSQTKVSEADKRSNDPTQIDLQRKIFNEFGYFYERKSGEFHDGLVKKYVKKNLIIKRDIFLKAYYAFKGNAKDARNSEDRLFKEETFKKIVPSSNYYKEMFLAYLINKVLQLEKKKFSRKVPSGLRYSQYALVAAIG